MTTTSDRDGENPGEPADTAQPMSVPAAVGAAPDDERPTVVLTAYGALPAYSLDNVLPTGPVGGRHREPGTGPARRPTPTRLGRVVLPASLALVSAVALLAAWTHLQETREAQPVSAVQITPGASVAPPVTVPSATATPAAHGASSPAPATSASSTARPVPVVDRSVPVVVLNATPRTGLAAKVAARLRADGWKVVSIGNYRGGVTATTVFATGHADAVATIRRDLPTRDAVARPVGAMSTARLTVVVGPDYPRG
jgi:hypothetical protein